MSDPVVRPLPQRNLAPDAERWLEALPAPVLGTLTFIASEVVFFGSLIVAYLAYRTRSPEGPRPSDLDVPITALFSIALFASSATVALAGRRLHRGDQRGFVLWLLATIALAVIFLVGQATEYGEDSLGGFVASTIGGVIIGTFWGIARIGSGIVDVFTFPVPFNDNRPLVEPDHHV